MRYTIENAEFPTRAESHKSETSSGKIFNNIMPDDCIVRGVSERDYGIDYYIELTHGSQLTGDLVSIQLKGKKEIAWTMRHTHAISDIEKTTTNYWMNFSVPVFLVLTDNTLGELYYLPVKDYIRKNFASFQSNRFTYHFDKNLQLTHAQGFDEFVSSYRMEVGRERFESTLITMISSFESYTNYIMEHSNRDFHMILEDDEILQIDAILTNYNFLTEYLGITSSLPSFEKLKENSINPNNYPGDLYEGDLIEIHKELVRVTQKIVEGFVEITGEEEDYWVHRNKKLYDYLQEVDLDNLFQLY